MLSNVMRPNPGGTAPARHDPRDRPPDGQVWIRRLRPAAAPALILLALGCTGTSAPQAGGGSESPDGCRPSWEGHVGTDDDSFWALPTLSRAEAEAEGTYLGMLYIAPGVEVASHVHEGARETVWLICGTVGGTVGGRSFEAEAGDVVTFPADVEHSATVGPVGALLGQAYTPAQPGLRFYEWGAR